MTKLLILTFYYRPDLCAGSFRATALVNALSKLGSDDLKIDVLTTRPNRYASFSAACPKTEHVGNVSIHRVDLPAHRSDMLGQSLAFYRFARGVKELVADRQYDFVFATSSRLLTASLGAWVAWRKSVPLYLDIRDIFADTIREVIPEPAASLAGYFFGLVEKMTMRRAVNINLVSRGFEPYFCAKYPDKSLTWFTNGIDSEFIEAATFVGSARSADATTTILYAGNIGEGQCLHEVVPQLALALREKAEIIVIGDGGRRRQLEAAIRDFGVENVKVRPPVDRDSLIQEYRAADILFLHLGPYRAFEKVLPSKLFEYGAMGKPVLAGVSGFAARFVNEEISNSAVFAPCDVDDAVRAFESLRIANEPRQQFVAKYARDNLAKAMAKNILNWARGDS